MKELFNSGHQAVRQTCHKKWCRESEKVVPKKVMPEKVVPTEGGAGKVVPAEKIVPKKVMKEKVEIDRKRN